MNHHDCIIIGAGPAGLATAGCLRKNGADFIILEKSARLANSWEQFYDRLHLHTIKSYSHLPYRPFPKHFPKYIPKSELVRYYRDYAEEFRIEPILNSEVRKVEKVNGLWKVSTDTEEFTGKNIVMCTGLIRVPLIPQWEGIDQFKGDLIHSYDYKNPELFQQKRTLVVGMGNSGAEIALDLCESRVDTYLSVRGEVNVVPRDLLGNPVQQTAKILGLFPNWLGDGIGKAVRHLTVGDLNKYGIKIPRMAPARQLREKGKTPVLDIGTVKMIRNGRISVKPGLTRIKPNSVEFEDGSELKVEAIISATGYHPVLSDLLPNAEDITDKNGYPLNIACSPPHEGLYFVGFDVYSLGILNSIHDESQEVAAQVVSSLQNN